MPSWFRCRRWQIVCLYKLFCCSLLQQTVGDAIQASRDRGLVAALRSSAWVRSANGGLGAFELDASAVRQAISSLSAARKARPKDANLLAALGTVLACLSGRGASADEALDAALKLAPQHYLALLARGVLRSDAKALRMAVQHHPSRAEAHLALGQLLASTHDSSKHPTAMAEAKAAFLKALELQPKSRLVNGVTVDNLRAFGDEQEFKRIVNAAVAQGVWRHPLQRPRGAYWSRLDSAALPDVSFESKCDWCRAMRIQVEAALSDGSLRFEFENAQKAPAEEKMLSQYVVQDCDGEARCTRKLGHARQNGRGRWAEWSIWDPSRFARDLCGGNFQKMCSLVFKLLAQSMPVIRMTVTEVHPPITHIPLHSSPQQGRMRLLCPLVVPGGSVSRLVFPDHGEKIYETAQEGECWWFDESFEHELHYKGTAPRASLIIDVPHPALLDSSAALGLQLEAPTHPIQWEFLHGALASMAAELGLRRDLWLNASTVFATV